MTIAARDRLIVALDLPSTDAARNLITKLGDAVTFYKIGYQLGFSGGLEFARELIGQGKQVFVDLKLHDIGNTVEKGVESIAKIGDLAPAAGNRRRCAQRSRCVRADDVRP